MIGLAWTGAAQLSVTGTVALTDEQNAPEAEDVVAGGSGFLVIAALVIATGFLIRSMSKHLRRIDFDERPEQPGRGPDDDVGDVGDDQRPG